MKPTYTFTLILNDNTEKTFSLYNENFSFTYGISKEIWRDQKNIVMQIETGSKDSINIIDAFVLDAYKHLINIEEIKEIKVVISREINPESSYKEYNLKVGEFGNFNIYYLNNVENSGYVFSFDVLTPASLSNVK